MVNITGLQDGSITTFYDLIKFNNTLTGNIFSDLLVVALTFIILIQLLKRSEPKVAIMVASFIMVILSLIFVSINLITPVFVFVFALTTIFSVIYNYATQ